MELSKGEMLQELKEEEDAVLDMRGRILKRISEIRKTFGADRFGKPEREIFHLVHTGMKKKISLCLTTKNFEQIMIACYRQR
jgi:hypothetical protein